MKSDIAHQLSKAYMLRIHILVIFLAMGLVCTPVYAKDNSSDTKPLTFGLLPYLSRAVLVKKFNPLIQYLEETLKRPVLIHSAPDFKTYIERASRGDYDVFLAAPHIAVYMEQRYQARRISKFSRQLTGYFVVHADSAYETLNDVRGKRLVSADPPAVITILGERALVEHKIDPVNDMVRQYTTHNNALRLIAQNKQDVAVVGVTIYDNFSQPLKSQLRILALTDTIPHMMFYSRSDLADSDYHAIMTAMLDFTAQGAGKSFFRNVAFGDMVAITDQDIEQVGSLIDILETKLKQ